MNNDFFKNFFNGDYYDGLGDGMFGLRHILWILCTVAALIALYQIFKKHKKAGIIFIYVISIIMFTFRFFLYLIRWLTKTYDPAISALPWHMCSLLALLLPITMVFNLKKFKTSIYSASITGAFITLVLGDYFYSTIINFYLWESMLTHSFMLILPFLDIAVDRFKIEPKKWWEAIVGILFFIAWASLANEIIFHGLGYNYMYLKYNALPFEIPGVHFFLIYTIMYLVFTSLLFGIPYFYRKRKNSTQQTAHE